MPHVHGNSKRLPANIIPLVQTKAIVNFIEQFVAVHALTIPDRMPG